jgi:RNA polymerase sigma factor (sigma-70 family)
MDPCAALLQTYVTGHSEAAFRELVERQLDLVYGTALRRTGGDHGMAREIAQVVFIDLARKAAALPRGMVLSGWLHKHTGFVASNMIRNEQRRRQREHTAAMDTPADAAEETALWESVAPLLDEALSKLPEADRDAVILRYLEGRGLREVGSLLGVSENTARMRVSRALEKLRQTFQRRGVTSTALLLGGALVLASRAHAPTGLAGPLTGLALKMAPLAGAAAGTATVAASASAGWLGKGAAVVLAAGTFGAGAWWLGGPGSGERPPRTIPAENRSPADFARLEQESGDFAAASPLSVDPRPPLAQPSSADPVVVPVGVPVSMVEADSVEGAKLKLGVVPAVMKFDKELLEVRAGRPVALLFHNDRCPLQHNFLLVKPGKAAAVGALADAMLTDRDAMAKLYLPVSPDILAQSNQLVGIGQSDEIRFTAPAEPGDYPYLCSFPGHWRLMQGILRVVP